MFRTAGKLTLALVTIVSALFAGALFSYHTPTADDNVVVGEDAGMLADGQDQPSAMPAAAITATETIPPYTPLPSLTPSQTLKPPPTFEPPTATPTPSVVPSATVTATTDVNISIPGLHGAETPTPTTTPGCETREWKLTYTVQFDDTLSSIAAKYGTWVDELAAGNCITDKNLIVIGQVLHVPGDTQPYEPAVACTEWQVLTPFNGSMTVPADGTITFNWIGPAAPKNLIRIYRPDSSVFEVVIELRQNESVNLNENLAAEGTYTWYVYPLDSGFQQIACLEGGPWTFYKPVSSAPTATPGSNISGAN